MNSHIIQKSEPFVYNGVTVMTDSEMLSLTDMWRAAGSDEAKRPAEWTRQDATQAFIEALGASNMGHAHIKTKRGNSGGTFAHWQVAFAYAKYLSPEFHMWCNQVVRERMEGKVASGLSAETLEQIDRGFGIMRMLAHKVTEMERTVGVIAATVQPHQPVIMRHGKTAGQIWNFYNLPKIKNGATWLGNRLHEMRCLSEGRGELGGRTARLFDPDLAETCMKNGLLHKAKLYASERQGQKTLHLVGRETV